jgi:adenosylcobinamide-phosphate synthase
VVGTALLLDLFGGEPPAAVHPVVGMGRMLGAARARRRVRSPLGSLAEGAAVVAAGAVAAGVVAALAGRVGPVSGLASVAWEALLLKPTFAVRALLSAGAEVEQALAGGDLDEARRLLGWHLVSRPTAELTPAECAAGAIESLAENFSDSIVAPLVAWRLGGLPAAYLYRWVNTTDATLGYRTPELEWYGKAAARTDDVLNLLPARLAAALIAAAAPMGGGSGRRALTVARRDASLTPSWNAGWPMATMAGALDRRLTKPGVYTLHADAVEPRASDIGRARRIVATATALVAGLVAL